MIELRLTYDGGGKFSTANHADWKTASQEMRDGEEVLARLVRPRSSRENRLFFGAIRSAWDNQRGGPLFTEEEGGWARLRAWLLCEAGYCDMHEFAPGSITKEVVAVLRSRDQAAFWTVDRESGVIRVRFPRSMAFRVLSSDEFQPIKQRVFELLCEVICPGTTPEDLMGIRYTGPRGKQLQTESAHAHD